MIRNTVGEVGGRRTGFEGGLDADSSEIEPDSIVERSSGPVIHAPSVYITVDGQMDAQVISKEVRHANDLLPFESVNSRLFSQLLRPVHSCTQLISDILAHDEED